MNGKQRSVLEALVRAAAEVHRISDRATEPWSALATALDNARSVLAEPNRDPYTPCYDAFSIGSAVRTPQTLLANIENAARRSACLCAIEQQFFTYVVMEEDDETGEEIETDKCDLNWGASPTEYVQQFRAALAKRNQNS
jgi:hypothetical protein